MRTVIPSCASWLVVCALAACGARTGLYLPDAEAPNSTDAGPPMDAGPPPADYCVEVPFEGGPVDLDLEVEAVVGRADIVFLIDVTASMGDEIERIRSTLRDVIAPAIRQAIPDSQLGVASFADFAQEPYGAPRDRPFEIRLPVTNDIAPVQGAVNSLSLGDGRDTPESQVEALYQLISGEGLGSWVAASVGCPRGGFGFACMRTDSMPVVLLFTDAPFHNGPAAPGPDDAHVYSDITPAPHTYSQMISELSDRGVRVIGFDSGEGVASSHLDRLARDTGTLAGSDPLVYQIGQRGQRLSDSVVGAIQTFAGTVEQDIDASLADPNPRDAIDPRDFVDSLEALRADPADGVAAIEGAAFIDALAGTRLTWRLTVRNDAIVPGPTAQSFRLEVRFRGDGRRSLGTRTVDIVVPGEDGSGCESM